MLAVLEDRSYLVMIFAFLFISILSYQLTGFPLFWSSSVLIDGLSWLAAFLFFTLIFNRFNEKYAKNYIIILCIFYFAVGSGIFSFLSVIFFILSSWSIGDFLIKTIYVRNNKNFSFTAGLFTGIALYVSIFGVMIHYKINYRYVYLIFLILPMLVQILFCPRELEEKVRIGAKRVLLAIGSINYYIFAFNVALITWVARFAFFPTIGYDDNANHLRIWTELSYQHHFTFDVTNQIWEVAPFAVNLIHAIVSLLAGEDARTAVNLAFMGILIWQMIGLLRLIDVQPAERLLVVLLVVSTPLLANLLISMQTELF